MKTSMSSKLRSLATWQFTKGRLRRNVGLEGGATNARPGPFGAKNAVMWLRDRGHSVTFEYLEPGLR